MQATSAMAPTHRITRRTTILYSIANTFDMNAMIERDLRQLNMPPPGAYS